ncbi:S8 family peptidase [Candidatus Saganbacteria bacterium]|nr:S8 family peptidase [Candidatus Saganbacteria bacterium]
MIKKVIIYLIILSVPAFASGLIKIEQVQDPVTLRSADAVQGEVLVKFKPAISTKSISALSLNVLEVSLSTQVYKLAVPPGRTISEYLTELSNDKNIIYAEPNYIIRAHATTPNDTSYDLQWNLPLIKAPEGWDISTGDATVVIADIDSGCDTTHPDLSDKITSNSKNFQGAGSSITDLNSHGTHTAGILAAVTNNSVGVAGVAWNCKIMVLRMLDAAGTGEVFDFNNAVVYAADKGAKVINMSLGTLNFSQSMADAVAYAYGKNCAMFSSSGNESSLTVDYPAKLAGVIAVSAVDKNKNITPYSNSGPEISVCAPGGTSDSAIYSTIPSSTYGYKYGTSMAAPLVSGLAALLFSKFPSITRDQVYYRITSEAEDLGTAGKDNFYGYGIINIVETLGDIIAPTVEVISPAGGERMTMGGALNIRWSASDTGIGLSATPIALYYSLDNGASYSTIAAASSNSGTYSFTLPQTPTAEAKIKISVADLSGNIATAESKSFTILNLAAGIYPYPIPARNHESIYFLGASGGDTLRIFDANGDTVRTIYNASDPQIVWDQKNSDGSYCSPGIYFYVISSSTSKKTGKLIILK